MNEGFFFVSKEEIHLKQVKLVKSGYGSNVNISVGAMTSNCENVAHDVTNMIFKSYDCAIEYQNAAGGFIYHCIPDFSFFLGSALKITGIQGDGALLSIDDAIDLRVKHFADHYSDNKHIGSSLDDFIKEEAAIEDIANKD